MQGAAKLAVAAGKLVSAEAEGDRAIVRFRARGRDDIETLRVARIVNCTGPELNIVRSGEPLLFALVAAGRIRPDPLEDRHRRRPRLPRRSTPTAPRRTASTRSAR